MIGSYLRRPSRIAGLFVLALAIAAAVLWIFPSGDYLIVPDPAKPVASHVFVQGQKPDQGPGGIYYVDVILRRAKLFESIFPGIHANSALVPASAINPPGVNDTARRQEDLRDMRRSQSIAAAVALRALGYHVVARPTGVIVSQVDGNAPAAGVLQPTDVIVAVDGKPVRTIRALRRAMGRHRPGDVVRFTLRRGKKLLVVRMKTIADPNNPKRAIVGFAPGQAADIQLPIKVRIDIGDVGGPSAGLAFALEVMDKLGRNVDHGYRVAATGEIALDGSVGPIGGVRQKVAGANEAHVDVFLVPAGDNAQEAKRHAGHVRVIAVQTFQQALHVLATLPRKR